MKILQVNKFYYPKYGGIETIVKQISEGLGKDEGWQVDVLACNSQRGISDSIENIEGVKVFKAKSYGNFLSMPISLNFFIWYKKIVKEYDLIILHHPFPLGFLAYWVFSKNKKMVVWYFSDIVRQKFSGLIFKPFLLAVLRLSSAIFVYSNSVITSSHVLGKFKDKIFIIPYGLDASFYNTLEVRDESVVLKDKTVPMILSVGRLVSYKGFEYLIEAMKLVKANLTIIGDGPLREKLTAQINDEGLSGKVKIVAFAKDLSACYQTADIFVLSSITSAETFGLVQLEAMACGLPVVNTSLPTAVPEVSLNGQTGITVSPRSSKQLADALNELVNNSVLREQYSKAAKIRVDQHFSEKQFLDKMKAAINNLVNEPVNK